MSKHMRTGVPVMVLSAVLGIPGVAAPYEGDPSTVGVTVAGRVTLVGSVPRSGLLPVHRDSKFCGTTMPNEALEVNRASRGIKTVVVSLEDVAKGKPTAPENTIVTLDFENRTCRFIPKGNATVVGSLLTIRNADPILHNTHVRKDSRFGPTVLNVAQPAGSRVIQKPLREVGFLDVRCDAHPFMHAAVHVFEHPYFAVTDSEGQFELTQVPPGTYRLRIWHETLGTREKTLTVPSTGPVAVDLELGPEG